MLPHECLQNKSTFKELTLRNGEAASLARIPEMDFDAFEQWIIEHVKAGCRIAAFFAVPCSKFDNCLKSDGKHFLYALLADDSAGLLFVVCTMVAESYPSLTPAIPALHLFERLIYEKFNLLPQGHPWLKPVRFDNPSGADIGEANFYRINSEDVHEVSVGPIHAGVIECGHFRFQCLGEEVLHLEISLGYHHRGVEKLLAELSVARIPYLLEVVAGDSTAAHAWACCQLLETLSGVSATARGLHIRSLALELERLACHTGDLGAIAGDVGFLPTSSFCGRLRGDWLNMSAMLCGSRFTRGLLTPGGTTYDLTPSLVHSLVEKTEKTLRDVRGAVRLMWDSPSVMARLTGIGIVTATAVRELGMLGTASRASGVAHDARHSHPLSGLPPPPILCIAEEGDVRARTIVRYEEILASASFCQKILADLPGGECRSQIEQENLHRLAPGQIAVALLEGWRGEVCHVALTDNDGGVAAYIVVDPSFHNWAGLALAMRGQQISDFPLCNKSFNLSYCGHDL